MAVACGSAVASFQVVDPSFGSGSPFDLVAEGVPMFKLEARGAGFACAWNRHVRTPREWRSRSTDA